MSGYTSNSLKRGRDPDDAHWQWSEPDRAIKRIGSGQDGGPWSFRGRSPHVGGSAAKVDPEQQVVLDLDTLIEALSIWVAATANDSRTQPAAETKLAEQAQRTGLAFLRLVHVIKDRDTSLPHLPSVFNDTDARLKQLESEIAGIAGELWSRYKYYYEELSKIRYELARSEQQREEAQDALRRELYHAINTLADPPLPSLPPHLVPPPFLIRPPHPFDPRVAPGSRPGPVQPSLLRNSFVDGASSTTQPTPPPPPPPPPPPLPPTPTPTSFTVPPSPQASVLSGVELVSLEKFRTFQRQMVDAHDGLKGKLRSKISEVDRRVEDLEESLRAGETTGMTRGSKSGAGGVQLEGSVASRRAEEKRLEVILSVCDDLERRTDDLEKRSRDVDLWMDEIRTS